VLGIHPSLCAGNMLKKTAETPNPIKGMFVPICKVFEQELAFGFWIPATV
jgi:hypothetical protein